MFCSESSECIDNKTPCGEKCLDIRYPKLKRAMKNHMEYLKCESCSSTYEWQCGFDCITKEELCNGTCANEFLYCPEYSKCIEITSPCEDKCLSVKYPKLKTKHKYRQSLDQFFPTVYALINNFQF